MKARIEIRFRPGVLDPEAVAIAKALAHLGFEGVRGVTRAKVIELELAAEDAAAARREAERMCEALLANPVIESWQIEILAQA